jgi:glycosyltransferase involved in cell wall biosynthesis
VPYRVLHLIDSLDLGGAQVVLLNLLRHADHTRFTHEAACLHGRGVFWGPVAATGVPLSTLSFHHYFPSYVPLLAWRLLARSYDIVHCHLLAANVIGKPLAALCRIPVRINHDHCNDKLSDPRPWAFPADTWSNRFASHVIAVSESTRAFVEHQEHVPAARTSTIHNGIDCEVFRPRPELRAEARQRWQLPADAFIVAGVGRLTYQKNFSLFLQIAAETLRLHPHAYFVIAGTGEEEPQLRDLAHALGIAERVRFLGYVPAMSDLYPAVDLLLLNSRFEGLPITILEAMATGLPIVASNLDGIAEVLTSGHDATLVPPGNAAPFTAAIAELINNPGLVRTYTERTLEKVRTHYSAARMTREVESIYLRYLEDGTGAARPRSGNGQV